MIRTKKRWLAAWSVVAMVAAGAVAGMGLAHAESNGGTRVMPLGDSIAHGIQVPGGYRIGMWQRLGASGHKVDFVGSQFNGPAGLGDHDGTRFRHTTGSAGLAIWAGIDHGTIMDPAFVCMGMIVSYRLPKNQWYWYRANKARWSGTTNLADPVPVAREHSANRDPNDIGGWTVLIDDDHQ